jgi:putative phosphonate transport system ATP-binding protein
MSSADPVLALQAPQLMTTPPLLTLAGVSRHYGDVVALEDVSATVYPGEVLGIVGESGSGKSTLLRMMNLEDTPDTGDYRLALPDCSGNLFKLDRFARRMLCATRIGIVYQNPHLGLLMKHTSSGNVAERLLIAGERSFAALRDRAREALDASEFPLDRMDARPIELSGGMQQRVAIAATLILQPRILLMDEPFGALDPGIRLRMQELLIQLWNEQQSTVFLVTHSVEEAVYLGDRVFLMAPSPGRLIEILKVPRPAESPEESRRKPWFINFCQALLRRLEEESPKSKV